MKARAAAAVCLGLAACTYRVDSLVDAHDGNPGDYECARAIPPGSEAGGPTDGLCTLRAAIEEANATVARDRIEIPPGAYLLVLPINAGGGRLELTEDVIIQGSGPQATTIEAGQNGSVFHIDGSDAVIRQLTIQGGDAQAGGGMRIVDGEVEMSDVVVRDNEATTGGGGIYIEPGATLSLERSVVRDNLAIGAFGGGLWNQGELRLFESEVSDNEGNRAGGIHNDGLLNLRNVTVSGNQVRQTSSAGTGGIRQWDFAFLNNVTVTDNQGTGNDPSSSLGGGIRTLDDATTVVKNSIIAGNDGQDGPHDCVGPLTSDSRYNLIGDTGGCELPALVNTWVLDTDPSLTGLTPSGGPTRVHRPFSDSPARGAGFPFPPGGPAADACEGFDQRGVPRPEGGDECDMGTVEITSSASVVARFMLVDADSDTDIRPLLDGDRLVLDELPAALTVRAAFDGPIPASVRFDYDGVTGVQIENATPYALGGDSAGDFNPFPLTDGEHQLTATPFTQDDASGGAGGRLTIGFEVLE